MDISIVRHGGLGDELCLTPTYRQLHRNGTVVNSYGAHSTDILKWSPYVDRTGSVDDGWLQTLRSCSEEQVVDILWHREAGYGHHMHLVDFYAGQVGVTLEDRGLDLFLGPEDHAMAAWMEGLLRPIVCYNIDGGWRTREVPMELVAAALVARGVTCIQVGAGKPYTGVGYNMVGMNSSIRDLGAMIHRADLYIGGDSGIYHAAAAVDTKSVVVYGPVDMEYRLHNQDIGIYECECHGCFSLDTQDILIGGGCPNGTYSCIHIDPDRIADRIMEEL